MKNSFFPENYLFTENTLERRSHHGFVGSHARPIFDVGSPLVHEHAKAVQHDAPLLLRDVGTNEIYSLRLERK